MVIAASDAIDLAAPDGSLAWQARLNLVRLARLPGRVELGEQLLAQLPELAAVPACDDRDSFARIELSSELLAEVDQCSTPAFVSARDVRLVSEPE